MSMISGSSVEAATLDALDTLRRTGAPSLRLDPATQALLERLAGTPPLYTLTPDAARADLVSLQREAQVRPAKDNLRGSGHKLPMVRRVAQLAGGSVVLQSTVGRGTEVTLQLPSLPR